MKLPEFNGGRQGNSSKRQLDGKSFTEVNFLPPSIDRGQSRQQTNDIHDQASDMCQKGSINHNSNKKQTPKKSSNIHQIEKIYSN